MYPKQKYSGRFVSYEALENGSFPAAFPTYNQKSLARLYGFVRFVIFECMEQDLVIVGVGSTETR